MAQTPKDAKKPGKRNSRSERLAAALRENLRRRKAQARGRKMEPEKPPVPDQHGSKE